MTRRRHRYAVATAALVLVACGGGGGRAPAQATVAAVLQVEVAGRAAPIASTHGGEELRIVGTEATEILVDNVPVSAVLVSENTIQAVTPPHAPGTVDITVLDQVLAGALEYRAPPRIDSVRAADGPTAGTARLSVDGGATLTIRGAAFRPPVAVAVGGIDANVLAADGDAITVAAPSLERTGAVAVDVRNEDGLAGEASVTYTDEFSLAPRAVGLDRDAALHFFRRAGFGAAPGDADAAVRDGLAATLGRLLTPVDDPEVDAQAAAVYDEFPPRGPVNRRANQEWWLHHLLHDPNVLRERMAYLWHDHFATSQRDFHDATYMLFDQIQLFRRNGLGNWRDLLVAVTRDPAMLLWLDGARSTLDAPNENFARELWELFMLGEGNGYTQADIVAASRAFTGFRLHHNPERMVYYEERHDDGVKTIFGVPGRFGYVGQDARDADGGVVDLTLRERGDVAARFVCGRLASHFLYDDPPLSLVDDLARTLRDSGWEIAPVVQRLLTSKAFFSARARQSHLTNPLEFTLGFLRATGIEMPRNRLNQRLISMGMALCEPPGVEGWPEATSFFGAQGAQQSLNFLTEAVNHVATGAAAATPAALVDRIAQDLHLEPTAEERAAFVAYAGEDGDLLDATTRLAKTRGLLNWMGQHHTRFVR